MPEDPDRPSGDNETLKSMFRRLCQDGAAAVADDLGGWDDVTKMAFID